MAVESGGGAYNPQEVCGALWYRKMSAADKRRITREAESMKQNPEDYESNPDMLTSLAVGAVVAGGLWLLFRSKPAAAAASPCAGFDAQNGLLENFGKVKEYTVWTFPNKPFAAGWPNPKTEYTSSFRPKAYSLSDCSFFQWTGMTWVKDDVTNIQFDLWRKS